MKILVAEDDAVSRFTTVRALEQLGYECTTTSDGLEAWDRFAGGAYDVVIADWMMPGIDGVELCRRIRESATQHYTYFIILTALAEREFRLAGMRAGADDYLAKPLDRHELMLRLIAAERVTRLHRQLEVQTAELERLNGELFEAGRRDALTGVGNRRRMQDDIIALEAITGDARAPLTVALFDIDRFKDYNDTYSHVAGDDVLKLVAANLACHLGAEEGFYRYGGEEFLALMRRPLDAARAHAELMRRAIEACRIPHISSPDDNVITVSAGVALVAGAGSASPLFAAIRAADEALLRAKREGRNRVVTAI